MANPFWTNIPDSVLDQEKQQKKADDWAQAQHAVVAQQWNDAHTADMQELLSKYGVAPDGQGGYAYQTTSPSGMSEPAPSPAPTVMPPPPVLGPDGKLTVPDADTATGAMTKTGQPDAGISDAAMTRTTTGEAPAQDQQNLDYPTPEPPSPPTNFMLRTPMGGLAAPAPLPFNVQKPTPPDQDQQQRVLEGKVPFENAQQAVGGAVRHITKQGESLPANAEGAGPGLRMTTSEDDLARAFARGHIEQAGAGGVGGLAHAAGKASAGGDILTSARKEMPPLPSTHGFDPAALPEYQSGSVEHAVESALRAAAQNDPEGIAHLSGEEMQALPFGPKTTLDGKPAPKYLAPTGTPRSLDDIRAAIEAGLPYKDWYGDVADYFKDTVGKDNMNEARTIFGITSAQTQVSDNTAQTFWIMRKARELLPSGLSEEDFAKALNDEILSMRREGPVPWARTWTGDKGDAVADAYFNGLRLGGAGKTPSYAGNFTSALAGKYDPNSTNDAYMLRDVFGFKDKDGAGSKDETYRYVNAVQNYLAREMGITPMQAQAAAWIAVRQLKTDKRAAGMLKAVEKGEIPLGEAVARGAKAGIYDSFPGNLDEITTNKAITARRDELLKVLNPDEAFKPDMRLEYPGQGRKSAIERPIGDEQRARVQGVVEQQAPAVGVSGGQRVLDAMGYDPEKRTVPWITAPHEITPTASGVEVRFPGGNTDTVRYHAALLGDATGAERTVIHHPIPSATTVIGAKVTAPTDMAALEAAATAVGGRVGKVGQDAVVYLPPRAGESTLTDLFHELARAGYNAADISPVTGASSAIERADYSRYLEALGRRFGATGDRSGLRDRAVAALRALGEKAGGEEAQQGSKAALGGFAGVGTDENGDATFDPTRAALGVAGGTLASNKRVQGAAKRFFHGTGSAFEKPDAGKFDENGLFGPGYYLTSDPRVASSYADVRATDTTARRADIAGLEHDVNRAERGLADATRSGNAEDAAAWQDQLDQTRDDLNAAVGHLPAQGPNVRAIDVPGDVNLFDAEQAVVPPDVVARLTSAVKGLPGLPDQPTGMQVYTALLSRASEVGDAPKALVNKVLAAVGFDGITHNGGQRIPMSDDAGKPIEHTATVIFPESMGKLTNAISGTPFGGFAGGLAGMKVENDENGNPQITGYDPALGSIAMVAGTMGTPAGRRSAAQLVETGVHVAASMTEKLRPKERQFKAEMSPVQPWIDRAQTIRYAEMLANVVGRVADIGIGIAHTVELPVLDALEGLHGDKAALGASRVRAQAIVGAIPEAFQAALQHITSATPSTSNRIEGGMSRGGRAFGNGPIGRAINLVPDAMTASDDFFKTINGAGAVWAEAYKIAKRTGRDITEVLADPSHDLAEKALRAGEYVTYTEDPGGIPKWMGDGARQPGKAGFLVSLAIPFMRVGANIATRGTKAAVAPVVGPLEAAFRAAQGDGEKARQALAKTELAAGLGLLWWSQWAQGNITTNGPDDPQENAAWRAAGNKPNSIKIAGQSVPLTLLGGFGAQAIILANGFEAAAKHEPVKAQRAAIVSGKPQDSATGVLAPETERFLTQWIAGAASGISDISYLKPVGDLFKSGGPTNPGFLARTASSFVGGDIANRVGQATDPMQREIAKGGLEQFTDTLKSRVPGLREQLPVKQDPLGKDVPNPGYARLMPGDETGTNPSKTLDTMLENGTMPSPAPKSIDVGKASIPLTRDEQRAYQRYAGQVIERETMKYQSQPAWAGYDAKKRQTLFKNIKAAAAEQARGRLLKDIGNDELKRRVKGVSAIEPVPIR